MITTHKTAAVGSSVYIAPAGATHGRNPNRTRTVSQEPEFIATIKARSMIRGQFAKGRQMGFHQMQMQLMHDAIPVVLTYSGGQWRASTQWGALVESHFCYVECARRAKLKGFMPVSAA